MLVLWTVGRSRRSRRTRVDTRRPRTDNNPMCLAKSRIVIETLSRVYAARRDNAIPSTSVQNHVGDLAPRLTCTPRKSWPSPLRMLMNKSRLPIGANRAVNSPVLNFQPARYPDRPPPQNTTPTPAASLQRSGFGGRTGGTSLLTDGRFAFVTAGLPHIRHSCSSAGDM